MNKRFSLLKRHLWAFVVTQDGLDLNDHPATHASRDFIFATDPQKLQSFNDWFATQVQNDVLFVPEGTPLNEPWVAPYVESGYKSGVTHAYYAAQARSEQPLTGEQFLIVVLGGPESVNKIRLLYLRTFEDLKGVTSAMGTEMSRILAQGLADGKSALPIAREMVAKIRSMTLTRALMIARTEIIRAHAEGQLDGFRRLGVEKLGVMVEFTTAHDDRVCPICESLDGKKYTIDEARGVIPVHPQCRCAWVPYVPTRVTRATAQRQR